MKMISTMTLFAITTIVWIAYGSSFEYGISFGPDVETECPDLATFKAAIEKQYNEGDQTDFANLLSDDRFVGCQMSDTDCYNKTELLALYGGLSSILSYYNIDFWNVKIGKYFIQSDIRITVTTAEANGACTYCIDGAVHYFCENDKVTQDVDFLNQAQRQIALENALNPNGCVQVECITNYDIVSYDSNSDDSSEDNSDANLLNKQNDGAEIGQAASGGNGSVVVVMSIMTALFIIVALFICAWCFWNKSNAKRKKKGNQVELEMDEISEENEM